VHSAASDASATSATTSSTTSSLRNPTSSSPGTMSGPTGQLLQSHKLQVQLQQISHRKLVGDSQSKPKP